MSLFTGSLFPFDSTGAGGTVTSVGTGTGLTGGPITTTGTISMANMPANTLKGNNTGSSAPPTDLTVSQVNTMLGDVTNVSGVAPIASSGGSMPAISLNANGVTNSFLAAMPSNTIKGNNTGSPANALDLTTSQVNTLLGTELTANKDVANGYAGLTAATLLKTAEFPAFTGDVTTSVGSVATTIANNAVTNAKLAQAPANSIKGNNTGSTANELDLTTAQVVTLLGAITSLTGDVTASGPGAATATVSAAGDFNRRGNQTLASGNTVSVNNAASPYTIATSDYFILVDTSGGAVQLNLPAPSTRRMIQIKDSTGNFGTNQCTLHRNGSEKIENLASDLLLYSNFGSYAFCSDGTNWFKISSASNRAVKIFTSSTTFTIPAGVTNQDVWLRPGAGGGGGGGAGGKGFAGATGGGGGGGRAGAGGGSSSFMQNTVQVVPGTVMTVTVGAGGVAALGGVNGGSGAGSGGTGSLTSYIGGAVSITAARASTNIGGAGGGGGGAGGAGALTAGGAGSGTGGGSANNYVGLASAQSVSGAPGNGGNGGANGVAGSNGTAGAGVTDQYFGQGLTTNGAVGTGGAQSGGTHGGGGGGSSAGSGSLADNSEYGSQGTGGVGGAGSNGGNGNSAGTSANTSNGSNGTDGTEGRGGGGGGGSGGTGGSSTSAGTPGTGGNGGKGSDGKIVLAWME